MDRAFLSSVSIGFRSKLPMGTALGLLLSKGVVATDRNGHRDSVDGSQRTLEEGQEIISVARQRDRDGKMELRAMGDIKDGRRGGRLQWHRDKAMGGVDDEGESGNSGMGIKNRDAWNIQRKTLSKTQ